MQTFAAALVEIGGVRDGRLEFIGRKHAGGKFASIDCRGKENAILCIRDGKAGDLVFYPAEGPLLIKKDGIVERAFVAEFVEDDAGKFLLGIDRFSPGLYRILDFNRKIVCVAGQRFISHTLTLIRRRAALKSCSFRRSPASCLSSSVYEASTIAVGRLS